MKILYVEDQLTLQAENMCNIFSQILGHKIRKEIKDLVEEEYGASADEIKKIIAKTQCLDIADNFPDAVDYIKNYSSDYDMFIVDRNLAENNYEHEDVHKFDENYTEEIYNEARFYTREGDWLLNIALYENTIDEGNQFYFLTAHNDDIKTMNKSILYQSGFSKEKNIIVKEPVSISRLKKIINNYPAVKFENENKEILKIIRDRIGLDAEKSYMGLHKRQDRHQNLNQIRQFFENHIIRSFITRKILSEDQCINDYGNIYINGFIKSIHPEVYITDDDGELVLDAEGKKQWEKTDYDKFHSNRIIQSQMKTINHITQPASHQSETLSKDTSIHTFTALRDIIRWIDHYYVEEKNKTQIEQ